MSKASELIERMERETGQRVDENDFDNHAMAGLLGAIAREMGKTPGWHNERDDVAVGSVIKHQMSAAGQQERESREMIASLLMAGFSPDDLKSLK